MTQVISHETDFRLSRYYFAETDRSNQAWLSLLLEIEGSIDSFINSAECIVKSLPADDGPYYLVPAAYDQQDRKAKRGIQPLVIYARVPFIKKLNVTEDGVLSLHTGVEIESRFLDFSVTPSENPAPKKVGDDAVIMAVVDDGLGFAHELFRTGTTESRVEFVTIMEALPKTENSQQTSVGRSYEKGEIDQLLATNTFSELLDEDQFYVTTGQLDYRTGVFSTVALQASHGSHAMGLAAGHLVTAKAVERPIICAALPSRLVEDTTGIDLLPSFYLAFHILVKQARRFVKPSGEPAPVVFNLSYGNSGGPHDGTGLFARLFEYYMEEGRINDQKIWLTLPAGNTNLSRLHGKVSAGQEETRLDLEILPDDRTTTQVQIWLPYSGELPNEIAGVELVSPFGQRAKIVTDGNQHQAIDDGKGAEIARLSYQFIGGNTQRGLALVNVNVTTSQFRDEPLAPSGRWELKISRDKCSVDDVEVWIRRDETLPGHAPGGRQAFFNNPDYQKIGEYGQPLAVDPPDTKCPVRRAQTLSGFACGQSPIVTAAYTGRNKELSDYSAAGPLNQPASDHASHRNGPDLAALGDDSEVLRGVYSAGSRSGSFVRQSGSSSAAPRVARAAATGVGHPDLDSRTWAKDPPKYSPDVRKVALNGSSSPERRGSGAYDIPVAFDEQRYFEERACLAAKDQGDRAGVKVAAALRSPLDSAL